MLRSALAGDRVQASTLLVSRRDDRRDALFREPVDRLVDQDVLRPTYGEVGDGGLLAVQGDPVDARNEAGHGGPFVAVQDPDGDEVDRAGDTVGLAAEDAGDLGAVAVAVAAVLAVADRVEARRARRPNSGWVNSIPLSMT